MALGETLYQYRMAVVLTLGLGGPILAALVLGVGPILDTAVQLIVLVAFGWSVLTAAVELYAGVQRYRQDTEPTDQPAEGEPA